MQNITNSYNLHPTVSVCKANDLQKGQQVNYEGERAHVIVVKPVLVIKTQDRVVCGALRKHLSIWGNRPGEHDKTA